MQNLLAHLQVHSCMDDVKAINAQIITLKTSTKDFYEGVPPRFCNKSLFLLIDSQQPSPYYICDLSMVAVKMLQKRCMEAKTLFAWLDKKLKSDCNLVRTTFSARLK